MTNILSGKWHELGGQLEDIAKAEGKNRIGLFGRDSTDGRTF